MHEDLVVLPFRLGPLWNMAYVIGSRSSGRAIVLDPAWDVPRIRQAAEAAGLEILAAVVTHAHHDHAHGLSEFAHAGVPVFAHPLELGSLERECGVSAQPVECRGSSLLGAVDLRFLHTPGHTPGSLSVLAGGALFTGDALMVGALGRTGAYDGAREEMWRTVHGVLAPLPEATVLYPGHDAGRIAMSTLGEERAAVPALRAVDREEFFELVYRHLG